MFGIILLAIIQGIAEFLPISSSAHLIIFRDLFNLSVYWIKLSNKKFPIIYKENIQLNPDKNKIYK